ncbi:MAG: DKNYY domain-containing protein [bacterium]|nr:DKNYY domain-containing protein [bacterium]
MDCEIKPPTKIFPGTIKDSALYCDYGSIREVPEADLWSFEEISEDGWAKDKNYVYWKGEKLDAPIDPATITLLHPYPDTQYYTSSYIIDISGVWWYDKLHKGREAFKLNADPATFSLVFEGRYGVDASRVFYSGKEISGADPQSFAPLHSSDDTDYKNQYAKDKEHVYFVDSLMPDADPKSFTYLEDGYAKDRSSVYYNGILLADADVRSFSVIKNYGNDMYAVDKDYVFSGSEILDLDASSFEVLGDRMIKDSQGVYYREYNSSPPISIQGADAPTFQRIGECASFELSSGAYYRDKNNIYIGRAPEESMDAATFEYLGAYSGFIGPPYSISYARDKNAVYHSCGIEMEDADVATFRNIKDGYAKDADTVWFLGRPVERADLDSFRVLAGGYAKDAAAVYSSGDVLKDADAATFEVVTEQVSDSAYSIRSYGKDAFHVYGYDGQVMEGIDPKDCVPQDITACYPKPQP